MTAPWHSFGAHNGSALGPAQRHQRIKPVCEVWRLHVIRKTPEALIPPTSIGRIFLWVAQAPERTQWDVFDLTAAQRSAQCIGIELRIMPGARHRPNMGKASDAVNFHQSNELVELQCGMADRKDRVFG